MLKIGISNSSTKRTDDHATRGWELIDLRGPMDGVLTYDWEQSILKFLKTHGAKIGLDQIAGKFNGYTEAWLEESFPVGSINQIMELVKDSE
jgi:hypothetical protein